MNKDKKTWNYSFKIEQSWPKKIELQDWSDELDETTLELMFLDIMSEELTKEECSEARQMLCDIGIEC